MMFQPRFSPPRGVLRTSVAGRPGLRHARYYASPGLDLFVEHYWVVEWDLPGRQPERVETLPHPSVHMVFELGGTARIAGIRKAKFTRLLEGKGGVIAAKFRPGGFHPFLGVPVSTLTNTDVPIQNIFGQAGTRLARDLKGETTDARRIVLIEEFLRSRAPTPDETVARVANMVYAVARDREILKVEDLVQRHGLNKRTLQRLFGKYVGVSPKWVIQLYRLHEAAERLEAGSVNQVELALSLGYSDQAHFVRDFKSILGISPAAYARAVQQLR